MKKTIPVTTLFLDIGGVLLTEGWVHQYRKLASFGLQNDEGIIHETS